MTAVPTGAVRMRAFRAWQITRPFVNATLVLTIILVVSMLWLVSATRSFVDNTLADVKFGLLQDIDRESVELVSDLQAGVAEVRRLRVEVSRIADRPADLVDPETRRDIASMRDDADRIAQDLDRIASGHIELSQRALESLAVSIVRALGEARARDPSPVDGNGS